MENPYSLVFGKMPSNFIERDNEIGEIIATFSEKEPSIRAYILTGIRGCGKTVALSKIEKEFRAKKDYIVLSLNSDLNLLDSTAEELNQIANRLNILKNVDFGISLFGANIEKKSSETNESSNLRIDKLLNSFTQKGKRVLFCIDEISNTQNIKSFCQAFNTWLRKDYDVIIVMTGLKKNILSLQGDDRISFLKRAEKVELTSLSIRSIKANYEKELNLPEDIAVQMAQFTKGYPYAFQVLGYLCFKHQKSYMDIVDLFDEKLANNVYDIVWSDLTERERTVLKAIINSPSLTTKDILSSSNIDSNTYNEYRNILITKGLIKTIEYGRIDLVMPRFEEIAKEQLRLGFWQ